MTGGVVPSLQPTRFTDLPAVTTVNTTDIVMLSQGGRTVRSTVGYLLTQSSFVTDPMTTVGDMIIRNASNITARLGVGATASMLSVAAGIPAWTTSVWPATTTINQILYSSSANTVAGLATAATGALVTSSAGVPSMTSGAVANRLLRTDGTTVSFGQVVLTTDVSGILPGANGGTANGFFAVSGPTTSLKTFTFPDASATVLTSNAVVTLAQGGTGANLTASAGGILYSGAGAAAILSGTATANQVLLSGSSTAPAWSTATYPATTTTNQILYSSSANTVTGLATANTGALVTSSAGVPSITSGAVANRLLRTDGTTVAFSQVALATDVSGNLPVANLNSGTGAAAGTVWHGNATWSAVSLTADVTGTLGLGNGGTNAVNAAGARVSILPAMAGNTGKALVVNGGETDAAWAPVGTGSVTSVGLAGTAAEITVTGATPITTTGSWTLSLPASMTMTGKTLTGGSYTGATWENGAIGAVTPAAIKGTTITATGLVTVAAAGITFNDATTQTTAATAGLTLAQTQAAALSF